MNSYVLYYNFEKSGLNAVSAYFLSHVCMDEKYCNQRLPVVVAYL